MSNVIVFQGHFNVKFKLGQSFLNPQFYISVYKIKTRRDRNKHVGGFINFFRQGLISKRIKEFEIKICETSCSKLTIELICIVL